MKILMVCLGNICRSPLAEGILQAKAHQAGLNWKVDSAGTNGFHTGESPHKLSQKIAKLNGLDISQQRSRRLIHQDLIIYDKIYIMAADVLSEMKALLGEQLPEEKLEYFMDSLYPGQHLDVPDPWYGTEDGYHTVYHMIDEACDAIVNNYLAEKQTV